MHDQHERRSGRDRNRREVLARVNRETWIKRRSYREARCGHHQGVAVRGRLGGKPRCYGVSAAGAIVDDKLAFQTFGELLAEDAPYRIGRAAWRGADDHAHGFGWIIRRALRKDGLRRRDKCEEKQSQGLRASHKRLLAVLPAGGQLIEL